MGIAISVSCFIVQSLLTDFSIVLNSLQRRRKGLKAWNNSKKQILVLWTGIYYIWACFEFRISGSSSRTSENLRDGNSSGINTTLGSKSLTSRNVKPWVQGEFKLSSENVRAITGKPAAASPVGLNEIIEAWCPEWLLASEANVGDAEYSSRRIKRHGP